MGDRTMNVTIRPYTPDDLHTAQFIARNARQEDVTEASAFGVTPSQFMALLARRANALDHAWLVFRDGKPVFIFGFTASTDTAQHRDTVSEKRMQISDTSFQVWGFGTRAASHPKLIARMSEYIRQVAIPHMLALGAAEAHVTIPLTNLKSVRWLLSLGWKIFNYTTLQPAHVEAVELIWMRSDHVFHEPPCANHHADPSRVHAY